jgi:hypothetical protein
MRTGAAASWPDGLGEEKERIMEPAEVESLDVSDGCCGAVDHLLAALRQQPATQSHLRALTRGNVTVRARGRGVGCWGTPGSHTIESKCKALRGTRLTNAQQAAVRAAGSPAVAYGLRPEDLSLAATG